VSAKTTAPSRQTKPNSLAYDLRQPEWTDWRWQLQHTIRSLGHWRRYAPDRFWPGSSVAELERVVEHYPIAVTPYYLSLIEPHQVNDPLLIQVLPRSEELHRTPGELDDPIGDLTPEKGDHPTATVTHRYRDRVLFFPTFTCPIYCRFCFRRTRVGQPGSEPTKATWEAGLRYIEQHPEIREVILSGGEPLILKDSQLTNLLQRLAALPHLNTLRIHTRMLAVNPFRFTTELLRALSSLMLPVWIVAHFNHPRELAPDSQAALARLAQHGIPVLSQTVLLRGVNDQPEVLEELLLKLIHHRVRPYYLHHLDPAPGTSAWRVAIDRGIDIVRALHGRIPGYALPRYVQDQPQGRGKVLLYPTSSPEEW